VRVRHTAVGLNYIDTYHRSGAYKLPMPSGLGQEAAGVVEALGPGVTELKVGQRVAYGTGPIGAYCEMRNMPVDKLVPLPEGIADRDAAAMMLKGLTVQYLFRQIGKLKAGDTVLFHAAAGGVGLIACQWARAIGVRLIGTVSSDEKAALAKSHGCAETIVYTRENVVDRVKALTGGKGVPIVYDGVGKDVFPGVLDCLSLRGLWCLFGASSGPVPPLDLQLLAQKGSLWVTRPTLFSYANTREQMIAMSTEMFDLMRAGKVKAEVHQTFPLSKAADAHRALQGRQTTGATLLLP
jgi:NADPH2:quinone reductase